MSNRQATATWTDEFPTTEGAFYWVRCKLNHEDLDVASLLNGSLYFTYGGPTSKSRRKDFEYLGPITPNDHGALLAERDRLREALESMKQAAEFALTTPGLIRGRDQLKNAVEAAAVALA